MLLNEIVILLCCTGCKLVVQQNQNFVVQQNHNSIVLPQNKKNKTIIILLCLQKWKKNLPSTTWVKKGERGDEERNEEREREKDKRNEETERERVIRWEKMEWNA